MALMVGERRVRGRETAARARGACFGGGGGGGRPPCHVHSHTWIFIFGADMSQQQDHAHLDDCTPCRVVGMPARFFAHGGPRTDENMQAAQPFLGSAPSPTPQATRRFAPMKLPSAPARASLACAADTWPSQARALSWWHWASIGGFPRRHVSRRWTCIVTHSHARTHTHTHV